MVVLPRFSLRRVRES
jgi:hypothetical protein